MLLHSLSWNEYVDLPEGTGDSGHPVRGSNKTQVFQCFQRRCNRGRPGLAAAHCLLPPAYRREGLKNTQSCHRFVNEGGFKKHTIAVASCLSVSTDRREKRTPQAGRTLWQQPEPPSSSVAHMSPVCRASLSSPLHWSAAAKEKYYL